MALWGSAVLGLAVVGVLAAWLWADTLFDETGAKRVDSLTREFGARSVLSVFAHPDDELTSAGFLAQAAREDGVTVRSITATNGGSGHPDPPISRATDLGKIRRAEELEYGFFLGVDEQEIWEFKDGAVDRVPEAELVRRIVERIRRWRPDIVLTFDPGSGFTLHPDHRAIGQAATEAFKRAGDAEFEPGLGKSFSPRVLLYPVAPRKAFRMFGGNEGSKIAEAQPEPQLAIRIDPAVKIRGWQIQRSQAGYLRKAWHVPPWLLYRLYDDEYFAIGAGG